MIILTAFAAAAALLLIWAGVDHVREPAMVARQLAPAAARLVGMSLGAVELALGAAALAALAVPVPVLRWSLAAQAALYLGFLGHLVVRYRRHDRGDCACARIGGRIGAASLLRAGGLGLVSVAAAIGHPAVALPGIEPADPPAVLVLIAAAVLCLLLHALPPAVDGLADRTNRRYA